MTKTITLTLPEALCRDIEAMCEARGTDAAAVAGEYLVELLHERLHFPQTAAHRELLQSVSDGTLSYPDALERLDSENLYYLNHLLQVHGLSFAGSSGPENPRFAALVESRKN